MRSPSRRVACLALTAVAVAAGLRATAEPDLRRRATSDFRQEAELAGDDFVLDGAYSVPLSAEATAALKKGGELRLFDARGEEIPSIVHTAHARQEAVARPVAIFDNVWEPRDAGLIQTVSVELEESAPQSVNEFTFEIADEEYNVRVRIEASVAPDAWRIVSDNLHLIRHTISGEKIRYVHNVLRIPTSRFRRYRFVLEESGRKKPLTIESIAVREVVQRGESLGVSVRLEPWQNPRDPDPRRNYWKLDLGRPDLGVNRVQLQLDGTDYARPARLWSWNQELSRPGQPLADTVVFRYGSDARAEFEGFTTDAEQLVLMIDQGDDEPIGLRGARASRPRQQLRFVIDRPVAAPLRLYFTPDDPRPPKYDLDRRLRQYGIADFHARTHGPLRENASYAPAPKPMTERVPYLLTGVVIALVLGLGWYIARLLRTGLPPEPPAEHSPD
ncbi:MAG: hypothetical protein OEM49_07470 [Myxococcales bacterium]|nr:hypothetical protein [Myxococcales bacterium]MDH5306023.1 hypothetical protein [Myxococcales bacterium]MDH5566094.1 hypothetical protein [Myxococcales bacterium]